MVLRGIDREMRMWMQSARVRSHVEVELFPPGLDMAALRFRTFDPDSERAPEPLEDVSAEAPAAMSLDDIRKQGGPSLAELRRELEARLATGDLESAAALFNTLPDDLRRPVEILGLMHLLAGMDADVDAAARELVSAVRPDGSTRRFLMPTVTMAQPANSDGEES